MECNFTFKRVTNTDTTYCFKSYLPIKARNLVLVCGFCFIVFYIYGCKLKKIVIRPSRRLEKSRKNFTICETCFKAWPSSGNPLSS